jgi:hypothetical protein
MRRSYMILATVVAMVGTGCARQTVRESGGDIAMGTSATRAAGWGVDFRGVDGWRGTRASVFARPTDGGTQVALTIDGGIPGSRYGWEVREGTCGSDGRIVGDSTAYPPIPLGDQGMGSRVADLSVRMEEGKSYFVNLYGSASDRTMIIGCGTLTR